MAEATPAEAAAAVARESYGRLIAYLAARSHDIAAADDALGDALAAALRHWPVDGVPDAPEAWLLTTARRRLHDRWRHGQVEAGAEAIMLARGAMGDPWLFARVLGLRESQPTREEAVGELLWVMDQAVLHLGESRATGYLRKFYPLYVETIDGGHELQNALQRAASIDEAREILRGVAEPAPVDERGVSGSVLRASGAVA